jgi:hypothetical protein
LSSLLHLPTLDASSPFAFSSANAFKGLALSTLAVRWTADEAAHFALLNFDLKWPFSETFAFGA